MQNNVEGILKNKTGCKDYYMSIANTQNRRFI